MNDWETYLDGRFPGYLLPDASTQPLSPAAAEQFLYLLTGKRGQLALLRAASLLADRGDEIRKWVADVAVWVRTLRAQTTIEVRQWRGGFHGRLDVGRTAELHGQGQRDRFVTRSRRRTFDLPEYILVRTVAARLIHLVRQLREGASLTDAGWYKHLSPAVERLRHIIETSALTETSTAKLSVELERAVGAPRDPVVQWALIWSRRIRSVVDSPSPAAIADALAQARLLPLADYTRFELAATVSLAEALELALDQSGEWRTERSLTVSGRREIIIFHGPNNVQVRVYYNQSVLDAGPTEEAIEHYLGRQGRGRPDITVTVTRGKQHIGAVVVECKCSENPGYQATGYREAVHYRHEYARQLGGQVKACLVVSAEITGTPRPNDEVVASDWARWPPQELVASVVQLVDTEHAESS